MLNESANELTGCNLYLDKHDWESQYVANSYDDDDDDEFYVIGDRVYLDGVRAASVAYFGEVEFASGDWLGLVLDQPTGNHNGKVHGREYFQCAPFHGTFVRPARVSRMSQDSALGSSSSRGNSRTATPLPTFQRLTGRASPSSPSSPAGLRSKSPATSLGSYYYDDDYRQDRAPSVASLARRLKSIDEQYPTTGRPSAGILKINHNTNDHHQPRPGSSIGARAEELSRRIRAASTSPTRAENSVFNFRPKREQLSEYSSSPTPDGRRSVNLSSEPPRRGDRVLVRTERGGDMSGILRFMGETKFATGEWAGVELDYPDGKNDGQVLGHRYFHCPKNYGLFVPATRVRKATTPDTTRNKPVFTGMRSTIWSPPPVVPSRTHRHYSSVGSPAYLSSPLSSSYSPSSAYSSSGRDDLFDYDPYNREDRSPLRSMNNLDARLGYVDDLYRQGSRGTYEKPKFDDRDIDVQVKRSLSRPLSYTRSKVTSQNVESARPKAVKYTFTSSKYDGNPIARKTLVYD